MPMTVSGFFLHEDDLLGPLVEAVPAPRTITVFLIELQPLPKIGFDDLGAEDPFTAEQVFDHRDIPEAAGQDGDRSIVRVTLCDHRRRLINGRCSAGR